MTYTEMLERLLSCEDLRCRKFVRGFPAGTRCSVPHNPQACWPCRVDYVLAHKGDVDPNAILMATTIHGRAA